jgi:hypothetical protein
MNQTVITRSHHPSRPDHLKLLLPTIEGNVFMTIACLPLCSCTKTKQQRQQVSKANELHLLEIDSHMVDVLHCYCCHFQFRIKIYSKTFSAVKFGMTIFQPRKTNADEESEVCCSTFIYCQSVTQKASHLPPYS